MLITEPSMNAIDVPRIVAVRIQRCFVMSTPELFAIAVRSCRWPQPYKRSRCDGRINESIDRRLDRHAQRAAVPDRHLPQRGGVADERHRSHDAEDHLAIGAGRQSE